MDSEVTPSDTDSNITDHPNGPSDVYKHQVLFHGAVPQNGRLFLYMPGSGRHSVQDHSLLTVAADAGYHVIGLEYMNEHDHEKCGDCSDCYYAARSSLLFGYNHSSTIHITEPDSILNRLTKLLAWLGAHNPENEQWDQFLMASKPGWGKIVVAGHSQGGGQAALIAMLYEVPRVVMFASVVDAVYTLSGGPMESAQWLHRSHVTPIDRYFGFANTHDGLYAQTQTNWTTMGMLGWPTSVDNAVPPYGGANQLATLMPESNPHSAVVLEDTHYKHVWEYLVGP